MISERLSAKSIAWLAGLFDGEGSIQRRNGPCRPPALAIKMTDLDVLVNAQVVSGVGKVYGPYRRPAPRKKIWQWSVHRMEDVVGLAMTMYPFLGERRQSQIKALLDIWKGEPPIKRLQTHCKNGHPLTSSNLSKWPSMAPTTRRCRICHNEQNTKSKRRLRAAAKAAKAASYR